MGRRQGQRGSMELRRCRASEDWHSSLWPGAAPFVKEVVSLKTGKAEREGQQTPGTRFGSAQEPPQSGAPAMGGRSAVVTSLLERKATMRGSTEHCGNAPSRVPAGASPGTKGPRGQPGAALQPAWVESMQGQGAWHTAVTGDVGTLSCDTDMPTGQARASGMG